MIQDHINSDLYPPVVVRRAFPSLVSTPSVHMIHGLTFISSPSYGLSILSPFEVLYTGIVITSLEDRAYGAL